MNKAIALLLAGGMLASAATFSGVITESMCVKDHKAMNMGPDPECVRACVKSSKDVKYVLYDGKNSYKLSDQVTPEKYAGQKVVITGVLFEKTGIIKIDTIHHAR
jgi:hypothetical protein